MIHKITLREATLEDADAIANVYLASRKKFIDFAPLIHTDENIYQWVRSTLIPNEKVSQPVFAKFLNTTLSTIRQWEQGEKHPRGTSLKLLNLVSEKGLGILLSDSINHNKDAAA